jgi:hypothetical protein
MAESITIADKKRRKNTDSWWWMRADVDLSQLPVTVDLSMKPVLKLALLGALVLMAPSLGSLFGRDFDGWDEKLIRYTLVTVAFLAAYLAGFLFFAFRKRRRITFDPFTVTVERMGLFGNRAWTLPYSDFDGVLHRNVHKTILLSSVHLQVIELYHRNPEKTVPLYVQESTEAPREQWKAYAERLKLPALTDAGDDAEPRDIAETLQAIRGIVSAEDDQPRTFDIAAPPKGLAIVPDTIDGDTAERVAITAGRTPKAVYIMLATSPILLIAVFLYLGDFDKWFADPPWTMFGILAFFLLAPLIVWLIDRSQKRGIVVSRTRLVVTDKGQAGAASRRMFRLREIEEVRIKVLIKGLGKVLVIADRSEQAEFGQGLSDEALEWLRDYILAAAARE